MELFGTAGVRGSATERVTPEFTLRAGRAAGRVALESDVSAELIVGRDGRTTGQGPAAAVEAGLLSAGADVTRMGVVPTSALAFVSRGRRGVVLTASHNPPTDNDIKMFVDGQEYDRDLERDIGTRVGADTPPADWDDWSVTGTSGVLDAYRDAIVEFAGQHGADPDDLSVTVDYGNGMSALGTSQTLRDLSTRVVTLSGQIDGRFPGRGSKPTPEMLADLIAFVADGDLDFGIGYDGNADRIVIIDGDDEVVHEDTVIAMVAGHYVRVSDAEDPVAVTTPNTSGRVDERVCEAGDCVERVRLGALHEGIASARTNGGDVVFAAEPWKHVHPSLDGWIDGVASAALVARLAAESGMAGLREPVTERPYRKVSVPCPDENKRAAMAALEISLPKAMAPKSVDTEYGVRLEFVGALWTLVCLSGTEPYIRVYSEADGVDALVSEVAAVIEGEVEAARAGLRGNRSGRATRRDANTTPADVNRGPVLGDLQTW